MQESEFLNVDRYSLVSVKVSNFKLFEELELDFTKTNGNARKSLTIFGNSGAGKSTLVDVIQWCSYGTSSNPDDHLYRQNIFPSHWKEQEDDISVLLRLRPEGVDDSKENDIQCERTLTVDDKDDQIQVTIGKITQSKIDSKEKFQQIFGIKPKIQEGVMWILREQEMKRMSETVANEEASYFLDFMNLRVPKNGLTEMNRVNQRKINSLQKGKSSTTEKDRIQALTELADATRRAQKKEVQIDEILVKIHKERPTDSEKRLALSMDILEDAKRKFEIAETNLNGSKIKSSETKELLTTLLAAKLTKSNINIDKSINGSKFPWEEIATFLEPLNLFDERVVQELRELSHLTGLDTSELLAAKERIPYWKKRVTDLKTNMKNYYSSLNNCNLLEADGITFENTSAAKDKSENYKSNVKKYEAWSEDKIELDERVDDARKTLNDIEDELSQDKKSDSDLVNAIRRGKIIRALIESIKETDRQYKQRMFEETIERVEYFWGEIYPHGIFTPVLVSGSPSRIALKKIANGAIHELDSKHVGGKTSNGEGELLLVCTCLAIAESSGAKMPVVLDDCFTKIDPLTRENLVKTVTKEFGSLIYVTNDHDKAKLHKSAEGIIHLNYDESWRVVNEYNMSQWATWRDSIAQIS